MKIAYIVLAHRFPEQIIRLINRINDDNASIFIHLDKKVDRKIVKELSDRLSDKPNVYFVPRHMCFWGGFGIVEGALEGIKALVKSDIEYDYAMLLSGQDYPIKSIDYIKTFLEKNRSKEFIESFSFIKKNRWSGQGGGFDPEERIKYWHFRFRSHLLRIPIQRKFLNGLEPHGGPQWWCLSRSCIEYIYDFVMHHPEFVNYFRYVFIPDECFFHTIISNSPFKAHITGNDLKYADWENPNPTFPATLCKEHFNQVMNSPKLFARKFDMTRDPEILDLIDQNILLAPVSLPVE